MEAALRAAHDVAVIAELKRRSPSKGALDAGMDASTRAHLYADAGARALSVLTEPHDFGGSNQDLIDARVTSGLPVLRKDFHVHPTQVWEARAIGASAVLLIARALGPDGVRAMADVAREASIEAVVEIRDAAELEWALEAGATMIGVNRRDLETLRMHDDVIARLLPALPDDAVAIAESGVRDRAQVEEVARLGADAVLVGSALSVSTDPHAAVALLTGVPRRGRHG